jgi:L-aminoadipate-semialdehyde dehydrogenase
MTHPLIETLGLDKDPRVLKVTSGAGGDAASPGVVVSMNPATGKPIAAVKLDDADSYERIVSEASEAFRKWRLVPAPERGQVVRAIAEALRENLEPLGELVALEVGKIRAEGIGEVQETVDIADFAVGLSRQLHGITMPSERPEHRMYEQWLPLGLVGVITAFNFPNAVWGWNAMLGAVCGDVCVWKPSLIAPLTAIATNHIASEVADSMGHPGIFRLVIGQDDVVGERMIADRRFPLISATGSCRMGRHVGSVVAGRLGRSLLELGGNNGVIVEPDADLDLAAKAIVFGAVGTCGQRCTSTRRLFVHDSIADAFVAKLVAAYRTIRIGDPLDSGTLVGPLINEASVTAFENAIETAKTQGGEVLVGGERVAAGELTEGLDGGHFVKPTIIRGGNTMLPIAMEETFAPILFVSTYTAFDEALAMHNSVDQGLSSAIFTGSLRTGERFAQPSGAGSDCGLVYVNQGTSGAEIGGAFGGEKDTGGGRESGSDAWKAYMRRQTVTVNFGEQFALAQGIRFE